MTFPAVFRGQRAILAVTLALAISACSTSGFRAEVSRFHQLTAPAGETFGITPGANVEDGIEYKSYLGLLVERLSAQGYAPALSAEGDYQVFLDYGSRPDPGYRPPSGPVIGIGVGGFGSHVGGGVSTAIDTSDTDAIYFLHSVNVVINDAGTGQRLYEGTAAGHGKGSAIAPYMRLLLDALFQGFPGASGTTNTVKLDSE